MKLSIKLRITIWFTTLMTLLTVIIVGFMLSTGKRLVLATTQNKLIEAVSDVSTKLRFNVNGFSLEEGVATYHEGVFVSIYDETGYLLYGEVPEDIKNDTAFIHEEIQEVHQGDATWFVYDSVYKTKHGMVWIRGMISRENEYDTFHVMSRLVLIGLPFLILLAAVGGYIIAKKAFRPIQKIIKAADEIGDGKDLSQRINLGEGKDEVYALANTFDRMMDRLQASFENEKQFTSDASHELRTPTTVIISQCEYALEHAKTVEEAKEALDKVLYQSHKMSNLISQLLLLARADKGQQKLNLEQINLSELTEVVVEQQTELAQEKKIHITSQIEPEIVMLGDETLLMRMLINLISNGISYGKEEGKLAILLSIEKHKVKLVVQDNGIGIAKENIHKIWSRFYQVDSSRSNSSVGLGLAMVKWIVEAHNGSVMVESELGKGSVFTVILPMSNGEG